MYNTYSIGIPICLDMVACGLVRPFGNFATKIPPRNRIFEIRIEFAENEVGLHYKLVGLGMRRIKLRCYSVVLPIFEIGHIVTATEIQRMC